MVRTVRVAGSITFLLLSAGVVSAQQKPPTPKEIDLAIKKGTDALRAMEGQRAVGGNGEHGIGPSCLSGLAMLEGGVPLADPALKSIIDQVRNAAYTQTRTYQVSLCLMFLDRLGEPADVPLIQILAARLLVGQSNGGGWSYDCCMAPNPDIEQRLRAIKAEKQQGPPKLYPEVAQYAANLAGKPPMGGDDNSNTQFAVIAVWMSRKHGVPVEDALNRIETRFLTTQNTFASWPYAGLGGGGNIPSSPSMYCAGLIGLATAIGRREERRAKTEKPKVDTPPKKGDAPPKKEDATPPKAGPDDDFFKQPEAKTKPEAKKPEPKRVKDTRDIAAENAMHALGTIIAQSAQAGKGGLLLSEGQHGYHDLYFFWSLERVCVIYGVEKLGDVDWYEAGAQTLIARQGADGSWGGGAGPGGGYGAKVNTAFAVLFLCRSNLARDLSGKVQRETNTEMRAGYGPGGKDPKPSPMATNPNPAPTTPAAPILPDVNDNQSTVMAAKLVKLNGKEFEALLKNLRDAPAGERFTEALVTAITRMDDGNKLKESRQALADRLTRMKAEYLRALAKAEEAELRRGAVLAMAQRDDKAFIPDLIAAITDNEEIVVRAAKAGLMSLTKQDLGPVKNATIGEKKIAAEAWQEWYGKQKK